MTRWPLVCESCGAEIYVGTLYGGECGECHRETVRAQLEANALADRTNQSGLTDFGGKEDENE